MKCIHCLSLSVVRNGHSEKGIQRYKCNGCGRRFCQKGFFARFKHTTREIANTVYLKMHRLSLREVGEVIKRILGVEVSHVTIYNWCRKFIAILNKFVNLLPINFSRMWHIDEKFIKIKGSKDDFAYLFVALAANNKIIATLISNNRNTASAKAVLVKSRQKAIPEILVTDDCQIYKKACKIFGRKVKHIKTHFKKKPVWYKGKLIGLSNNRIERLNSDIDLFLHGMRGLKSFETAQIDGFTIYHNYLKPSNLEWYKIPKIVLSRGVSQALAINYVIVITF